ncbi:MAG: hypothetical protein ABJZ55_21650 [Fuerstiella sp.]
MTSPTVKSDPLNLASLWAVVTYALCLLTIAGAAPHCLAQNSNQNVSFLTGKKTAQSLQRLRSVTLQAVPLADVLADLQASLQYAIVLDHRVDPQQPITLTTGLVNSREVLHQVAQAAHVDVSFAERFAAMGPSDSVSRLRTVMELRRTEVRALRAKLDSKTYQLWFDEGESGWLDLMQPNRFVTEQVEAAGMACQMGEKIPHDLWRAQQLPSLDLVQRLTVVLNQFDLTFQVDEKGVVQILPVDQFPTLSRRIRVPKERRSAVEALLQATELPHQTSWSGSRLTLQATIELAEAVEAVIRNEEEKSVVEEGLKTQLFTMSIPAGSTVSRVIESLKASGISIRMEGGNSPQRQAYLQSKVQLDAKRMVGAEFFPALFQVNGGTVQVEGKYVLIQL